MSIQCIQCPKKVFLNCADKAGLSVKHNDMWDTTKSITMVKKRVTAMSAEYFYDTNESVTSLSNGKQDSKIVAK